MTPEFYESLRDWISLRTLASETKDNRVAVQYLKKYLVSLGFEVFIEPDKHHAQPVIIAKRQASKKKNHKVVLYNHYDVEPIGKDEQWNSDPFSLTESAGRLYARGIADNKAVLLARLFVLKKMIEVGKPLPEILWLIQGQEEVGGQLALEVFPEYVKDFEPSLFVEETGYHRDGNPIIFHKCDESILPECTSPLINSLNKALFSMAATVENRTLSKFQTCPFVSNIPKNSHYIGFGPNDYQAQIHGSNESMDKILLTQYFEVFEKFITWTLDVDLQDDL